MEQAQPPALHVDAASGEGAPTLKRLLVVAAVGALLAACGTKDDPAEPVEPEEATLDSTAMGNLAGTYEVKLADGSVMQQTINPDGTYVEATADGTRTGGGTWRTGEQGKMCFDPEGDEPEECYAGGAPGEDGAFEVRGEDGKVKSSVRKLETEADPVATATAEE